MKHLPDYVDPKGFIFHHDDPVSGSGYGDSCQRTFMFWIARYADKTWQDGLNPLVQVDSSWFYLNREDEPRRHWHEKYWPGQKGFMSRDNLLPAVCALAIVKSERLKPLMWKIIFRGGFLWNTKKIGQQDNSWKIPDFCGPLMLLIGMNLTWLASNYIKLPIWFHLIKSRKDPDDTSDDLNIQVALMTLDLLDPVHAQPVIGWYCKSRARLPDWGNSAPGYRQAIEQYFLGPIAPPLDLEWFKALDHQGWP